MKLLPARLSSLSLLLSIVGAVIAASGCSGPDKPPPLEPEAAPLTEEPATPATELAQGPDHLRAAVEARGRPEADRARDSDRKPLEVLRFADIELGMEVADLMCGPGYYMDILSRAVGPEGKVYCQNNAYVVERFVDQPLRERLSNPELGNVVRLDRELEDPGLPTEGIDVAMMVLFYHDTFWQKTDRARMLAAVHDALRPGGTFLVIDHHAEAGSGARDVQTLHRIDAELVKKEVTDAGFELVAESDALAHPEDDRKTNVFDDAIRGKTDRFILKFRKPATE